MAYDGIITYAVAKELNERISLGKISAQKLERRGINRAVAVIGNADHFEIWNADLIDFDEDDDLDDLMFDAE